MDYISTRNTKKIFSFKEVFLNGLASDGGLYIPKEYPFYTSEVLNNLKKLSYRALATKIILDFCGNEFNKNEINNIVNKSYDNFRIKDVVAIRKLENLNLLELFHGPTLAFKDIAMQVIGNIYENILNKNNLKVNIVVATSGDTGAAAIDAIKNKKNIKIFVLHPKNKISDVQRKIMTTVDKPNVFNIALDGNFDDCQKLVKSMFESKDFKNSINMSGVNSINWARIIFQIVYYFYSYFKISDLNEKINFSVPTGNFGDIYAGYVAKKMGLPINKLVIATNENDILKRVLKTGKYKPKKVEYTISPSMDIQVASNFERLIFDITSQSSKKTAKLMEDLKIKGEFELNSDELKKIKEDFVSENLNEKETKLTIKTIYGSLGILVDPHTAVGIGVVNKLSLIGKTITLATAHPCKFSQVVFDSSGIKPDLPEKLKNILSIKENYDSIPCDLSMVKNYILERCK